MKPLVVYMPMSADIIHPGHIQLLKEAEKYGEVIVGLLSDNAIEEKKGKRPIMTYDERLEVVNYLKGVSRVMLQDTPDYAPNLKALKPSFIVHGDDWSDESRESVLEVIKEWGGELIETDYSANPTSSTIIKQRVIDQIS